MYNLLTIYKKKIRIYLILIVFFITIDLKSSFAYTENIFIGINGHPLTQEGYKDINIYQQIKLLKELNIKYYRIDLPLNDQGVNLDKIVDIFIENNINIVPIIFQPIDIEKNSYSDIYNASYNYAFNISSKFKNKIFIWELHNELSNYAIYKKGDKLKDGTLFLFEGTDGRNIDDYENNRYSKAEALIKGLNDGIHHGNPMSKTIVNGGWLHYGFIQRLVDNNINFDIIGWHWYSNMGNLNKSAFLNISIIDELKKFNKEIWINESNYYGGSLINQDLQLEYFKTIIANVKSYYPFIKGYFIYELLDEPYFGNTNPESSYGLVKIKKNINNIWIIDSYKKSFYYFKEKFKE